MSESHRPSTKLKKLNKVERRRLLKKAKVIGHIYQTKDYNLFQRIIGNRPVMPSHVEKVGQSIEKYGDLRIPTIVNKDGEIIDHQHLTEARKNKGLPIIYTIIPDLGIEEVHALNEYQRNWSIMDYVRRWAEEGNQHYVQLLKFVEEEGYPISPSYCMLTDTAGIGSSEREVIKGGGFEVESYEKAVQTARAIDDLTENCAWLRRKEKFLFAIMQILRIERLNYARLKNVLDARGDNMNHHTESMYSVKKQLQFLYNNGLHSQNKLRFYIEPL